MLQRWKRRDQTSRQRALAVAAWSERRLVTGTEHIAIRGRRAGRPGRKQLADCKHERHAEGQRPAQNDLEPWLHATTLRSRAQFSPALGKSRIVVRLSRHSGRSEAKSRDPEVRARLDSGFRRNDEERAGLKGEGPNWPRRVRRQERWSCRCADPPGRASTLSGPGKARRRRQTRRRSGACAPYRAGRVPQA